MAAALASHLPELGKWPFQRELSGSKDSWKNSIITIRIAHFLSEFWVTHNDISVLSEANGVQNKPERPAGKEQATWSA